MSFDRTPSYTTEDFSAVNEYIGRMAIRHDAAIFEQRARAGAHYLKWGVIALAVCGVSVALIIWAWGHLIEKPEPRIIEPYVVQPPEVKVVIDGSYLRDGTQPSTTETVRQAANSRVESITASSPPPSNIPSSDSASFTVSKEPTVINFVIFKEIPFARGKIDEVNVGMRYDKASDDRPSWQWCYVTVPNPSGTQARVDLANVFGEDRQDQPFTRAMARDMGVSVEDLEDARRVCDFE